MRGIPSLITDIRKKVFTEVARMAYSGNGYENVDDLPYIVVPGDQPLHRDSVFLERAIVKERVRVAMGLNPRPVHTRHLMTEGMDHAAIAQQYYEPPLVSVIPFACHGCATDHYKVTEGCQNCLAASSRMSDGCSPQKCASAGRDILRRFLRYSLASVIRPQRMPKRSTNTTRAAL